MQALAKHWKKLAVALLLVAALLVPVFLQNQYILGVVVLSFIWAIAVYGLNVLLGYTGQLSLAHAGFFGIGAYTVGVLTVKYGYPFWPSLLAAVVMAGVIGFLVGIFALRTRNEYFAIFTLGVGFVIYLVIDRWESVTGGALGLIGVPYPEPIGPIQFEGLGSIYYLVLAFLVLTIYVSASIARSLVGRSLRAVRNSEELAMATGINVGRTKQLAFTVSTAIAGLSGGLYATYIGFLGPAIVNVPTTFEMLLYLLVGGMGSLSGPLVGALLVSTIFQFLQQFEEYRLVIFGPLLVVLVIFFPKGLAGLWSSLGARLRGRVSAPRGNEAETEPERQKDPAAEEVR